MKRYAFALLALLLAVPVTAQVVQVPVVSVPPPTLVGNATVTGSFSLASPAAGTLIIQRTTVTCTIATDTNCAGKGTATIAITNAIPAGSLVLGVDARVTTVLAGSDGLATFDIGHAGDTDACHSGWLEDGIRSVQRLGQ